MIEIKLYTSDFSLCWWWKYIGRKINYFKQKHEILLIVRKEVGEEMNINNTKYIVMSRDKETGRIQNIKINNILY